MKHTDEYLRNRLETCRRLFFQYEGREHSRIEREMRAMGFKDFNRRCLYARGVKSGWIEKYRWDRELQWRRRLHRRPDAHRKTKPLLDLLRYWDL